MTGKITETELRDQVKTLSEKFLQRTAGQIPQLQAELARAAAAGDRDALRTFQEVVHKIHGSGAMFGFDLISGLAGNLEELAMSRVDGAAATDPARIVTLANQMRPVLEQLAQAVTAAVTRAAPST